MPIDPNLYPSLPNPQQRQIERLVALEQRMAAYESKRDLVVTPFSINTAQTASGTYYGGRLWFVFGGSATWTTPPAGNWGLGANLLLNGTVLQNIFAKAYTPAVNDAISFALPLRTAEFSPGSLAGSYGLDPGETWSLTCVLTGSAGGAGSANVSGLVIEWPQA